MKGINKTMTYIINNMNETISNLSRMVVETMIHISDQDNEIEDLKLQVQAAEKDFDDIRDERDSLKKLNEYFTTTVNTQGDRFAELQKIVKENVVVIDEGNLNIVLDSTIEPDKVSRFLELLDMTEDDLYD